MRRSPAASREMRVGGKTPNTRWVQAAAEMGLPDAQLAMAERGLCELEGGGGAAAAAEWLRRAAEQGHPHAAALLMRQLAREGEFAQLGYEPPGAGTGPGDEVIECGRVHILSSLTHVPRRLARTRRPRRCALGLRCLGTGALG